ncbi:RES family NAD+ phosphorylase [Piscinibacter koreensis]|uniref:RES family NAD+ phosphorylase n=1 Tax=Piscinibacter koreensis TaxID=2742824 RepID=UPI001C37C164|nr:RES family NAD+ phosphorylase [Schlegelella koreensis]
MIDVTRIPVEHTLWKASYRLIPSRYPTVGLYDAIADPADLDVVFAIEALANPRLRDEAGEVRLVEPAERVSGPGSTPIMAAFTHLNPEGSRFSDGTYGVYYAADTLETSVIEVSHHRAVFLRRTAEPAIDVDMRLITATVDADLHDLRGTAPAGEDWSAALDPDSYAASQRVGRDLREHRSWGIRFPSVRHAGGECVALLRPKALRNAKAASHIALHWDGERISHWYEKKAPQPVKP